MATTTPVALFVFNRPHLTEAVFARISEARPSRLLVVADGPREHVANEADVCAEVRRIATAVDWPCQVDVCFAEENMGCYGRISSGLDWVFDTVEEAIILEDDILPDLSFFPFCEEMLARYRSDSRFSMVTGFNIWDNVPPMETSYYFSRLSHIWGWATWRSSWRRYDRDLTHWAELRAAGMLEEIFESAEICAFWRDTFDGVCAADPPSTWDHQWTYTNFIHNALAIAPRHNLIENIGFGHGATHVVDPSAAPSAPTHSMEFPLMHPPAAVAFTDMDYLDSMLSHFCKRSLAHRLVRKLGLSRWQFLQTREGKKG